jgi:hypothetical protein
MNLNRANNVFFSNRILLYKKAAIHQNKKGGS